MKKITPLLFILLITACSVEPAIDELSIETDTDTENNSDTDTDNDSDNNSDADADADADAEIIYYLPFITTNTAQNISINQAKLSAHIELAPLSVGDGIAGNSNQIERKGIVWGVNENLSLDNGFNIIFNSDPGDYSTTLENLNPATTYYFNAYAINANDEVVFGIEQSFTTATEAPCEYEVDNYLRPIYKDYDQPYRPERVSLTNPNIYGQGNLEFVASSSNSIVKIIVRLNEIDGNLPLSGTYKGVYDFNNLSIQSSNEMRLTIEDYNGLIDFYPQGASNNTDTEIYIQNTGDKISFIFCDTAVGDYVLTGKFSYQIP
ncbi:hypothetical protein ACJRPK_06025 [Aquimarina sp. 2-A2]|uniref:hypothetical protein n=1 Tax=Aquimarina sp. 2-A2 TaxID=3382644 RepID=UPI00387F26FC